MRPAFAKQALCAALAWVVAVPALAAAGVPGVAATAEADHAAVIQRATRSAALRGLPSVSREIVIAAVMHAERSRPLVARLRIAMRDLAASDELLLRRLRTTSVPGDRAGAMAVQSAASMSFDNIDASMAAVGREIDRIEEHLDRSAAGRLDDEEILAKLSTLAVLHGQWHALAQVRFALDAALDGRMARVQRLVRDRALDVLVEQCRERTAAARNAALDLTTGTALYASQLQRLADGPARRQAKLERDAAMSLQSQLLALGASSRDMQGEEPVRAQLVALLDERRASLAALFPEPPDAHASSAASTLLWSGFAGDGSTPSARQWDQLQRDLLAWIGQTSTIVERLAPRWRQRNRAMVSVARDAAVDPRQLGALQTMITAHEALLQQLDALPRATSSGDRGGTGERDPRRVAAQSLDRALVIELLVPVELQLVNMTGAIASRIGTSPAAPGTDAKLVALDRLVRSLAADERALALAVEDGETLWNRFDAFLDRLIAERAALWTRLQPLAPARASDPLFGYAQAVSAALRDARATAEEDWRVRRMLREAGRADPLMRYVYGRSKHASFRDAIRYEGFIRQALHEMSHDAAIAQAIARVLDSGAPAARRARALPVLIAPLALPWQANVVGPRVELTVAFPTARVHIVDIDGPAPRFVTERAPERIEPIRLAAHAIDRATLSYLLAAQAPRAPAPAEQSPAFTHYMQQQVQKNQWSYYLTAGGGALLAAGACVLCPAAAPAILYGSYTAVGIQVVKDAAFAGAHQAVDANATRPESREVWHARAEHAETAVTVVIAAVSVHSAISAARTPAVVAREVETASQAARATEAAWDEARVVASSADGSSRAAAEMARAARDAGRLEQAVQASTESVADAQKALQLARDAAKAEANASTASRALRDVIASEPEMAQQAGQLIQARNQLATVGDKIATLQREVDAGRTAMQSSLETAGIARETGDMATRLSALNDYANAERNVTRAAAELEALRTEVVQAKDQLDAGRLTFVRVAAGLTAGHTGLETARVAGETISESGVFRAPETPTPEGASAEASGSTAMPPSTGNAAATASATPAEIVAGFPTDAERRGGRSTTSAPLIVGGVTPGRFGTGTLDQQMRERGLEMERTTRGAEEGHHGTRTPSGAASSDAGFPPIAEEPLPTQGERGRWYRYRVDRIEQGTLSGMSQRCTYYYHGTALLRPEDLASFRRATMEEHVNAWRRMSSVSTLHKVVVNLYFWPLPSNAAERESPLPADRIECR